MMDFLAGGQMPRAQRWGLVLLIGAGLSLAACNKPYQTTTDSDRIGSGRIEQKGTTGPVGERRAFTRQSGNNLRTGEVQVNGYLWRAALDTVSFMPLASADPYGGVIITDWYSPPDTPAERFKVTVLVRGEDLRSDGVKVTIFRQQRDPTGLWVDSSVENNTQIDMENIILSQARSLRNEQQNRTD
ncbi:MAG: DUF3576 domain-containing protein [Alphaproteobacteria bacterium]|nr:DUF3576 domain-containing protein [Alphaproteobacteria bacterium]